MCVNISTSSVKSIDQLTQLKQVITIRDARFELLKRKNLHTK
jgi:hypothetical protein